MTNKTYRIVPILLIILVALTGCGGPDVVPTPSLVVEQTPSAGPLTKVTIALGYIPNVQFASYYVALQKGYYRDEGLDVEFRHGIVPDLIKLLGFGQDGVNFAAASGDEIIPARIQGIPVKYVMTWYRQYPVAVVANSESLTLNTPADLRGKTIGIPGPYGANYVGLKALLKAGGLTEADVKAETIGFTQVESVLTKRVEAAMVYAANEPVQLRKSGLEVNMLMVSDYVQLAANGLATNDKTVSENPDLVRKVVRATRRGIQDTIDDPESAFSTALLMLPDAGTLDKELQMSVLMETLKLIQPKPGDPAADQPLGWTDKQVWDTTQDFLLEAKLIPKKGNIEEMFTNGFIER